MCSQLAFVQLHRIFQSEIQRVGDQGVPYGYLRQAGDVFGKMAQVVQVQVVTGVDAQPKFDSPAGCGGLRGDVCGLVREVGRCVTFGV